MILSPDISLNLDLKHRRKNNMTQEKLIKFLKENLKIEVTTEGCWTDKELGFYLYLGDEIISSDFVCI